MTTTTKRRVGGRSRGGGVLPLLWKQNPHASVTLSCLLKLAPQPTISHFTKLFNNIMPGKCVDILVYSWPKCVDILVYSTAMVVQANLSVL